MTKSYYTVITDRKTAVAYIAAEYGVGAVTKRMANATNIRPAVYRISDAVFMDGTTTVKGRKVFTSRKMAEAWAARVNTLAAFSFGRIDSNHCPFARVEAA